VTTFNIGDRVRLDNSGHWSSLAAGKTATVAKVTPGGEIELKVDGLEGIRQWDQVEEPHITLLADNAATRTLRERLAVLTAERDDLSNQSRELADKQFVLDTHTQTLTDALAILEQNP
jgi:hypothetical protein